jgi:hypothetical protein
MALELTPAKIGDGRGIEVRPHVPAPPTGEHLSDRAIATTKVEDDPRGAVFLHQVDGAPVGTRPRKGELVCRLCTGRVA